MRLHRVKKRLAPRIRIFAPDGTPLGSLRGSLIHPVLPLLKGICSGIRAAGHSAYHKGREAENDEGSQKEGELGREERIHGKLSVGTES